ncbi:dephospho-CoA kinase [Paenibacillus silvae]|uniref:Dephospho-CoA kinase n=1 Tax=Paenibacillus silvae TaxID=1325358 RepID=A0A2W6N8I5_9BACL|nr:MULTISPECIES: dephospho-CoA kinase [Paenibacillus]MCK6074321.1 dephospho-CoA kinase [Paenibacillus silvae]MCK6148201.1 dephospho-CoA kinase [Paenibacillus silvae]MCK6266501.1 dephospho-CoA kinase [Paenibacillus silvae]PZT51929.1 dephospho-CoA kinase [Paenibacillus silvae]GGH57963.1 dephospho-CoA kinase [Paenibacillus silvae]
MNIGLTGGIATGKSSVSAYLASKGALLIDADVIAREVMMPGHPVLAAAVQRFGQAILNADGTLDRKKLGSIVFQHPEERKALEAITHPAIRKEMRERAAAYEMQYPDKLVVSDIPLLYESGLEDGFEEIMVVYVPREVQLERLMSRDQMTLADAEARIAAQMDIERKKERANIVIDNSGSWAQTEKQLQAFLTRKGLL